MNLIRIDPSGDSQRDLVCWLIAMTRVLGCDHGTMVHVHIHLDGDLFILTISSGFSWVCVAKFSTYVMCQVSFLLAFFSHPSVHVVDTPPTHTTLHKKKLFDMTSPSFLLIVMVFRLARILGNHPVIIGQSEASVPSKSQPQGRRWNWLLLNTRTLEIWGRYLFYPDDKEKLTNLTKLSEWNRVHE